MASPSIAVPRPGGRPSPSGPMLMSHGAISAGAMGCPNCGAWARAADATVSMDRQPAMRLGVDIADLPLFVDAPACDGVVVVDPTQAPLGRELRARRLHHAGIISGAALQHGGTAVPVPRCAEAHGRLWQDRTLQGRRRPALSAVGRHFDLPDAAVARPG